MSRPPGAGLVCIKGNFLRGFLAGLCGGLAGSAAKAMAEKIYPPRTEQETPPPVVLMRRVAEGPLEETAEQRGMLWIHYGFGAIAGGFYGALVEAEPLVATAGGALFGTLLNLMMHRIALPYWELSDPP